MPVIVYILAILFAVVAVVLLVTSKNPTTLSPEQWQKYSRILMIMFGVFLLLAAVRSCTGGF
ncbi:hypothetical protein [Salinibius halmophilus]|uniref:hypothetical protein n=1 Tax=Salinibius halmophilus TaxID=1853216 RepID=UPI000E66DE3C|nr:hypothetical protein [Salinibius halmophilus]